MRTYQWSAICRRLSPTCQHKRTILGTSSCPVSRLLLFPVARDSNFHLKLPETEQCDAAVLHPRMASSLFVDLQTLVDSVALAKPPTRKSSKLPKPPMLMPPACPLSASLCHHTIDRLPALPCLCVCAEKEITVLTMSPAACLLCCPIGDSVGNAFSVNRLVMPPRPSLPPKFPLNLLPFWFWFGERAPSGVSFCLASRGA